MSISASKQQRIDVWRTEVAAMTLAVPATSGSSTASTTTSSSGASDAAGLAAPTAYPFPPLDLGLDEPSPDAVEAARTAGGSRRRRSLWRRIARRVIRRGGAGDPDPSLDPVPDAKLEQVDLHNHDDDHDARRLSHHQHNDEDPDEAPYRTDMYRGLRTSPDTAEGLPRRGAVQDVVIPGADSSHDDDDPAARRVRNRDDRLDRAARLLGQARFGAPPPPPV